MSNENQLRIFEILRQRGLLSVSMQKVLTGFMAQWGVDSFKAIVETHFIEEGRIADILSDELKFPRLTRIRILNVSKETLESIPYDLALDLVVFPFEISDSGRLHVVFADPSNPSRIKQLESVTGKEIEVFIGERSEIIASIQRNYPLSMQLPSLLSFGHQSRGEQI